MAGWTQTQLNALEDAISQGALIVQYNDKKVQYRSLGEMLRLRNLIRKELGLTCGQGKVFPTFSKGFR